MFVREHQNQFRGAQADVQRFFGARNRPSTFSWNKPVGVSFIYIMLVGAGGAGNGGSPSVQGGGSGAISVWFGPAKNVPNSLRISISPTSTSISSDVGGSSGTITMMSALGTLGTTGASAATMNGYWAQGFSNFTSGINGSAAVNVASTLSFLSGGVGSGGSSVANYGYTSAGAGYFLFSPIIVGVAEASNSDTSGAYGCGSHWANPLGTPGLALIASW